MTYGSSKKRKKKIKFYLVAPWGSYITHRANEKRKEKERHGEDQDLRVTGFVK